MERGGDGKIEKGWGRVEIGKGWKRGEDGEGSLRWRCEGDK